MEDEYVRNCHRGALCLNIFQCDFYSFRTVPINNLFEMLFFSQKNLTENYILP